MLEFVWWCHDVLNMVKKQATTTFPYTAHQCLYRPTDNIRSVKVEWQRNRKHMLEFVRHSAVKVAASSLLTKREKEIKIKNAADGRCRLSDLFCSKVQFYISAPSESRTRLTTTCKYYCSL